MQTIITIQDLPESPIIENHLRKKAERLTQFYQRVNSCRIVITIPQKHKHKGKLFSIHINLTVPGKELVATRKTAEDIYVAIRDAFKAVERQLGNYAKIRRGTVKSHNNRVANVATI